MLLFSISLVSIIASGHGIVHLFSHHIEPASSRLRSSSLSPRKLQQSTRDPYSSYYPAPVSESFIKSHRCQAHHLSHPNREIPNVEQYDQLFRDMLQLYDGGNRLHHKQTFMGTRMGQFPFDLQVITEILYEIKPDLVIETGTNAGGFSIYLATLLSQWNVDAKILTVDSQPLKRWQKKFGGELPSEKEIWKKHVVYKQMNSDANEFLAAAKKMTSSAQRVLIVLDSFHEIKTVWDELLLLCIPYVTNSSYCIVEDTVLGTPLDALRIFFNLTESSDFCLDSDREYFGLSQHRGGYLKRIHENYKYPFNPDIYDKINRAYRTNKTNFNLPTTPARVRYAYDREKLEKAVNEVYISPTQQPLN